MTAPSFPADTVNHALQMPEAGEQISAISGHRKSSCPHHGFTKTAVRCREPVLGLERNQIFAKQALWILPAWSC